MNNPTPRPAVILGAGSQIAPFLSRQLAAAGYAGDMISRHQPAPEASPQLAPHPAFPWSAGDLNHAAEWSPPNGAWLFATVPLWLLPDALEHWPRVAGVVAFSSTSAVTKADSPDIAEQQLAQRLQQAEQRVLALCADRAIPCSLLRPTLIYGTGRDRNVSAIAGFIRRFGFFPLASPANGLRQPVHAADLAAAAIACIDNPTANGQAFNLPGGETLSYRDMVRRIFVALGKRPITPALPLPLLKTGLRLAGRVLPCHYSPALFERMNQNLRFDPASATGALGYQPRSFQPEFHDSGQVGGSYC